VTTPVAGPRLIRFDEVPLAGRVAERHAVRALAFRRDRLLLLRAADGSLKLPGGGGATALEEHEVALGLTPVWVALADAVLETEADLAAGVCHPWTERELAVLRVLGEG
jgi:hypothetical protein